MARILLTPPADTDTADIITYLAVEAGRNIAAQYVERFEALYERLALYPDSGSPRPALGAEVRIGVVSPFIVIYAHTRENDTVIILRLVHGQRKVTADLLKG